MARSGDRLRFGEGPELAIGKPAWREEAWASAPLPGLPPLKAHQHPVGPLIPTLLREGCIWPQRLDVDLNPLEKHRDPAAQHPAGNMVRGQQGVGSRALISALARLQYPCPMARDSGGAGGRRCGRLGRRVEGASRPTAPGDSGGAVWIGSFFTFRVHFGW